MAQVSMVLTHNGSTYNSSTFDGLALQYQTEVQLPPTNGSIKKAKKH